MAAAATTLGFGALVGSPALATSHGKKRATNTGQYAHEARGKRCKKAHGNHACRRPPKPKAPGSPSPSGAPAPSPTSPGAPTTPGNGPGAGSSPAAAFSSALVGTTYERYTSSSLGSDFTDDYTFCADNTFLEHTESYDGNGGYVVGDYRGTWNVTSAMSASSANVAYTTNNPNLPSSGTVLITLLSNGLYIGSNDYYTKGPASC